MRLDELERLDAGHTTRKLSRKLHNNGEAGGLVWSVVPRCFTGVAP